MNSKMQSNPALERSQMANVSVEQALKSQVKFDIGDDEDMTFKQKNMLLQKYGVTPAIVTAEELAYWEMREREGDGYVRR
jgi:hypothetical protein